MYQEKLGKCIISCKVFFNVLKKIMSPVSQVNAPDVNDVYSFLDRANETRNCVTELFCPHNLWREVF